MRRASDAEARAAAWIAREDAGACSPAQAEDLRAWLEADTANRVAYLRLRAAWERADRLRALSALREPSPQARRARWMRRGGALAACVAGLGVAGVLTLRLVSGDSAQLLATPVGGEKRVALSDGSKLTLNTDTQVRAEVTGTRRLVVLEKGEAFFDVRHDSAHPFTVIAGDHRITDLGTRFSVRRAGEVVTVVVEQGRVRIEPIAPSVLLATDTGLASAVEPAAIVDRNAVAVVSDRAIRVVHQDEAQVARDLTWRDGVLSFNQTTLAEAADEFNRYNAKKLIVDRTAASIRIDGAFRSGNVAVFARLLKDGFGLKVEAAGDDIKISA